MADKSTVRIRIPQGYVVEVKPSDETVELAGGGGKFVYTCTENDDELIIESSYNIEKTVFPVSEYSQIRDFFTKIYSKPNEIIVLKKNPVTM
jgi:hypothetical protein